jgi:AraC-like DNA-binding protein
MRYLAGHERLVRGTFDFPIELYYVDENHPRYEMPLHWHMEHELILILQGTFTMLADGKTIELKKGDSMMLAEETLHGGMPDHCIYECVVFDLEQFLPPLSVCGERIGKLREQGSALTYVFREGTEGAKIVSSLFQAMETEQKGYEFSTTGLLWQLLGLMLEKDLFQHSQGKTQGKGFSKIKPVLQLIRSNYADALTLRDLAGKAAMEPKYFCRVFRQLTGKTPVEYLNYYRVECAAELLCMTDHSVTEIALECGFNDVSYFNRLFRRQKGASAREFRKQHQTEV